MKQIAVLTVGSRGDIQPFIALCLALNQIGHKTKLVTYAKFESLISQYGVEFSPLINSYEEQLVNIIRNPGNPLVDPTRIQNTVGPILDRVLAESWQKCQGADAIINAATAFWGFDIAERLRIPNVSVGLIPLRATEEFPHCVAPQFKFPGFLNKLSGQLVTNAIWAGYGKSINRWRRETLGLEPWNKPPFITKKWRSQLELLAYSPSLLPQPKDWGEDVYTTGFWFLNEPKDFTPDQELLEFLAAGDEPIYVGFGSMAIDEPERYRLSRLFSNALVKLRKRGIFHGAISERIRHEEHIYCLQSSIPHSWLLPRTSLAIHHGGIGTTGASLRAGCPSIVLPFYSDQTFWANRLYEVGVSLPPFKRDRVSEHDIVQAIEKIYSESKFFSKAQQFSEALETDNGVKRAASLIDTHIRFWGRSLEGKTFG